MLRIGTIFYGGNFAVRATALERIGGFDTSIEFHGEDTNVGRRLFAIGRVALFHDCYLYTSARRYVAMGKGAVFRLYVRNFTSELLHHRPKDTTHTRRAGCCKDAESCLDTNRSCSATFTSTRSGATASCRCAEVVDLYGSTGKFDVIAITDHILMKKDLLARAGRIATLGRRAFGVREDDFDAYLEDIRAEADARAASSTACWSSRAPRSRRTGCAARRTRTSSRSTSSSYISADQSADDILREIRRQGALSIACHPHHRTTRRIEISTCYLWDHRERAVGSRRRLGSRQPRRSVLGDEPQALPVRRQQRLPQAEASLLVEDAGALREELAGGQAALRDNVDVALTLFRNGSWAA